MPVGYGGNNLCGRTLLSPAWALDGSWRVCDSGCLIDNARLALNEGLDAAKRQEKVARAKIEDASEAADVAGALDRQAPNRKVGIERSLRMAGEKPSPNSLVGGGRNHAVEREPRPLQRDRRGRRSPQP